MTPESLSCPYCNSLVILPRLPEAHQQIRCPRCQEVFPYRGQGGTAGSEYLRPAGDPAEGTLADANGRTGSKGQRLSNWALARVVLAVMGLTAGIALIFAWSTTDSRRQRDRSGPTYGQVPAVAPAKLAGLGYLPSNVDFIAGIHVAELRDRPETGRMLYNLRSDGIVRLRELESSIGLTYEEIDHVVIGINLLSVRLVVVVQTREPYDKHNVRKRLEAGIGDKHGQRTVYRFPLKEAGLDGYLWCADERTLVFTSSQDLKDIPAIAETSVDRFAAPTAKILNERLSEGTQVWSVGHFEDWEKVRMFLPLLPKFFPALTMVSKDDLGIVPDIRTMGAWIQIDKDATYHLEVGCKDTKAAKRFDDFLAQKGLENGKPLPFLMNRMQSQRLATDLAATLKREQKEEWVIVEAKSPIRDLVSATTQRVTQGNISYQ